MVHRPIPPHHHVILWIGVVGFAVLIGSFWVMGLDGLFRGAPSRARILDDTVSAWEQVRVEADETIARITATPPSNEKEQKNKAAAMLEILKNRLNTNTITTTTTATSTPE